MLAQRIIYGGLALAVILLLFLTDIRIAQIARESSWPLAGLFERGSIIPLGTAAFLALGALEMNRIFRFRGLAPHATFAVIMVLATTLAPWLSAGGLLGDGPAQVEGFLNIILVLAATVVGAGVLCVLGGSPDGALGNIAATLAIVFYVGFLGSFAIHLRCGRDVPDDQGAWLLLISIFVIKASDIGAFFAGTALGRHKLSPAISPAKTVEGMTGGIMVSALVAVGIMYFGTVADAVLAEQPTAQAAGQAAASDTTDMSLLWLAKDATLCFRFEQYPGEAFKFWLAALFGITLAIFAQIGDLLESCFKRDAHIKDSGHVMPRFGGILDLIDSPLVALPVAWYLLVALYGVV